MTVTEFDSELAKDRIIKWIKADTELYQESNPQGDAIQNHLKLNKIIYGVAEDNHWESEVPPFLAVSNADLFVASDDFFGSVVSDELTSSYEKYRFDLTFVVQAFSAEITERQIDFLHKKIKERLKSNVLLKDVVTDTNDPNVGTLINGTEICATSKCGQTVALNLEGLTRRLFAYRITFEVEVQV